MISIKRIGTHSGQFHADEVLACTILTKYVKEFFGSPITRTRDQAVLDQLEIAVDVGGVYDPELHRYDHHQRSFTTKFNEQSCTVLSSAGLIYKHFGREMLVELINQLVPEIKLKYQSPNLDQQTIEIVYQRLYENFIKGVDAIDNGVNQYTSQSRYSTSTSFEYRISRLNPMWTEEADDFERFTQAMKIADEELRQQVKGIFLSWLPARKFVEEAIQNRMQVHESGEIICFVQCVPWKSHLNDLEAQFSIEGKIKFVLFQIPKEGWRVQAVNVSSDSFSLRCGLVAEWRGIKDLNELKRISGIEDIVFVHASGFIGGAMSYDNALQMAVQSIGMKEINI